MKKKKNIVKHSASDIKEMSGGTDFGRLKAMKDKDIDTSDIPELDKTFWDNAILVRQPKKQPITLRLDEDVLSFYKDKIGKGYQTFINDVLRTYAEAHKNPSHHN